MLKKRGKTYYRTELTLKTETIRKFHKEYYIPALEKLRFYSSHVKMLSKQFTGNLRNKAIMQSNHNICTACDYAEMLAGKFDLESQSSLFGQGVNLSIEGCHDKYMVNSSLHSEFHSHFADKSPLNSAYTHEHMKVMIARLTDNDIMKTRSTIWYFTDGCSKQYRCDTAVYLLSYQSVQFKIIIDRLINAPGHGKDILDALNAIDKVFEAQNVHDWNT